jgi:hypothetical protein
LNQARNGANDFRTPPENGSKTPISGNPPEKRTESGTVESQNAPSDPELALIVRRWPDLPAEIRDTILRAVQRYTPNRPSKEIDP